MKKFNPLAVGKNPEGQPRKKGLQNQTSANQSTAVKTEPLVRYSDTELAGFKKIILEKLEIAKSTYAELKSEITHASSNDTEDTSPTFKVLEEGASSLSKEEKGQLAQRQYKFIQSLEASLIRVENKTYGICRETGKLIPKERLLVVPHATLCVEVKKENKVH